ncbi:hypothetical protein [Candidatus Palauibacter sp.]|uniref:hypothetical protein n=1 Tax=Candidatus Palauibacter sp. TaxID=3101350 RepID=UPI003B59046C
MLRTVGSLPGYRNRPEERIAMSNARHLGLRRQARGAASHRGRAPRVAAALALVAGPISAQTEPPSAPPADWEATAIDYSNVPYPHPVSYLGFHAELIRFLRSDPDEPADRAWRDTDVGRTRSP